LPRELRELDRRTAIACPLEFLIIRELGGFIPVWVIPLWSAVTAPMDRMSGLEALNFLLRVAVGAANVRVGVACCFPLPLIALLGAGVGVELIR